MRFHPWVSVFLVAVFQVSLHAQPAAVPDRDPNWLLPLPEIDADPKIPTLQQVVGFAWAREITSHAEIQRYLHALAKAAPDQIALFF